MEFEYHEAKRLVKHYDFLKGYIYHVNESKYTIDLIVIAPTEPTKFAKFLEEYLYHRDNDIALSQSGFNSKKLKIILMDSGQIGLMIYAELDRYLTVHNIAKVYDTEGWSL